MGWNTVRVRRPNPLITDDRTEHRFYFVHSYYAECARSEDVVATAHHGIEFPAVIGHENIHGVQFHPEKSHRFGMEVVRHFVEL
jgi:glutamine amidotransferase